MQYDAPLYSLKIFFFLEYTVYIPTISPDIDDMALVTVE